MKCKVSIAISMLSVILLVSLNTVWATGPRLTPQLFESEGTTKIVIYEYPPLTTFDMPNMGLCPEIIQAAFLAAGVAVMVENQVVKSLAVYSLIQDNSAAMVGEESDFTKDQLKQLKVVPCYIMEGRYFYYRPNHKTGLGWDGQLDRLKGYTYGALAGEDATAYEHAGIKTVTGDNLASLFTMLRDGKIDFLAVDDTCGEWFIRKHFSEEKNDFAKMAGSPWKTPFSIIFNQKHPRYEEIFQSFTKGFQIIKQSGKYSELIEKYGGL
nr:ABC transporter substrate-binding protein [uncultured Desulfobacter sp.]